MTEIIEMLGKYLERVGISYILRLAACCFMFSYAGCSAEEGNIYYTILWCTMLLIMSISALKHKKTYLMPIDELTTTKQNKYTR